ncbi:reverse transcriptase domain-containing protein [Tanacetum coccineum]
MAEPEVLPEPWTLFTDGSSCEDGSGAGLILTNPERAEFTYAMRFGLPGEIISNNGKQFRDNPFKDWCEKLCIRQCFASVKHPQANGLVERANRSLGEGIKARLDERSKDWIEELRTSYGPTGKKGSKQQLQVAKSKKMLEKILQLKESRGQQVSSRATWSTAAMKQVMPGTKANLDPSGKDRMKLKSRLEKEHTNSKTAKEMKCRGH